MPSRPLSFLRLLLAALVGCTCVLLPAAGQSFSFDVSTGYNTTTHLGGSVLESGQTDANWIVEAVHTTGVSYAYIVAETDPDFDLAAGFLPNGPDSSWISVNALTATHHPGISYYVTHINLPSTANMASLSLSGSLMCFTYCSLLFNKHLIAEYNIVDDFLTVVNFTAPASLFLVGHNGMTINATNIGGAEGVRLTGIVTGNLLPAGGVVGDPQFVGLRGQSFQVHGIDGAVYNIVSENNTQINARFTFLESGRCPTVAALPETWSNCWSHPGSYMGDMSFQQVVDGTLHAALIQAGGADQGFSAVTMDGVEMRVGEIQRFVDSTTSSYFSLHYTSTHTVTLQMEHYESKLTNSDMFINQALRPTVPISQLRSHGLLGQTHSTKVYPSVLKYVEGDVDDYLIEDQNIFGTGFQFNKFLE